MQARIWATIDKLFVGVERSVFHARAQSCLDGRGLVIKVGRRDAKPR